MEEYDFVNSLVKAVSDKDLIINDLQTKLKKEKEKAETLKQELQFQKEYKNKIIHGLSQDNLDNANKIFDLTRDVDVLRTENEFLKINKINVYVLLFVSSSLVFLLI